ITAEIGMIQTSLNSTIAEPIEGLSARAIEWIIELINENLAKLQQMQADNEILEDDLASVTGMQTQIQRTKFDCLRNLGARPQTPPLIVQPAIHQLNQRFSRAKIERETIPRFDGSIRKFKKFWTPFKSLVWSNPDLDSAEKLRRLYANVNESVHRLLPDIDNTEIDLNQIEGDLKNEFQDEVKLQLEFRAVLAKLPEFKNCYDSQNWRKVEEVARDIKSLFPEDAVFHHTALKEIAKKLPFQEAKKLRLSARFTIETLLEICKEFITAESRMDNPPVRETATSNSEQRNRFRNDNRGQSYRANVATTQPSTMCLFCLGPHDATECLISLDERRRIVTQRRGCFRCLRAYTRNHECSRVETCQRCNRAHNLLIGCGNRNERGSGSPSTRRPENGRPVPNQSDNSNNARLSERSTSFQLNDEQMTTESTTNANLTQADGDRYTPVIQVIVEFNGRKQQVRAILDCGADVSHISLPCAQRLRAPIIDNGITQMSAFANPTTEERDLVTEIRIRSMINDNSVLIPLHVVPKITYGHYSSPTDEILKWMSERGFETTDEDDIKPPDVLIGNDVLEEHFWTGRREQIAPFLWAKETHFGWCVVGPDKTFLSKQTRQKTIARKCNLVLREKRH
ncbi:hypothetical protein, partial [Clostridioides difficile]|uniref:hypothetical protein n=1 Tax=Clostridioides difficile TaxID=1496 RepID=UPI001A931D70